VILKARQVESRLEDVELALQFLLRAVLPVTDSRFEHVSELLHERIWKASGIFPFGEEQFKINGDKVYNETSAMQGRILTLVEAVFPERQQCEAIKSEAKPIVWRFYNWLKADDETDNRGPQPESDGLKAVVKDTSEPKPW
jgi:hypothetical protein